MPGTVTKTRMRPSGDMLPWSAEASRERLSSTLFLAALIHGVVILGVTFSAVPHQRKDDTPTSLEVVLVTRDYQRQATPQDALLLAQQNLTGHGNAAIGEQLRTAVTTALPADEIGPDQLGDGHADRAPGIAQPAREELTTIAPASRSVLPERQGPVDAPARRSQFPASDAAAVDVLAEPDTVTRVPDAHPRELIVSASTREARVATYLTSWKNRVERIGTLNFPHAAELRDSRVHPVLEVAIRSNGTLREVVVRNSSGHRNLDQAAVDILRIAAPFDPFPNVLRQDYDVLRFAYEWHFTGGVATGRVTTLGGS